MDYINCYFKKEMIQSILITSLYIIGVYVAMLPGNILDPSKFLFKLSLKGFTLPNWISKPLFECPPCMASVHGSYMFFVSQWLFSVSLPNESIFIFIFAVCGLNYILIKR